MFVAAIVACFLASHTANGQTCDCGQLGDCALAELLDQSINEPGCHDQCASLLSQSSSAVTSCRSSDQNDLARTQAKSDLLRCAWKNAASPTCSGDFFQSPAGRRKRHDWSRESGGRRSRYRPGDGDFEEIYSRFQEFFNSRGGGNGRKRPPPFPFPFPPPSGGRRRPNGGTGGGGTGTGGRRRTPRPNPWATTPRPTGGGGLPTDYQRYTQCTKTCMERGGYSLSAISDKCARNLG